MTPDWTRHYSVKKSLVRNKPGFALSIGVGADAQEWLIEPQVQLGAAHGLPAAGGLPATGNGVFLRGPRRPVLALHRGEP